MFKRAIAPEPDSISLCKPFGQFDEHAPIRRILDFSKGNDQPQILNHAQIDLIIPKYLQQFITGIIGIVGAHGKSSRGEQQIATRDELNELAFPISAAILRSSPVKSALAIAFCRGRFERQ